MEGDQSCVTFKMDSFDLMEKDEILYLIAYINLREGVFEDQ